MKNILVSFFILVFLLGCATTKPKSYINTSEAIFILNKPQEKVVFVDFKDTFNPKNDIDAYMEESLTKESFFITQNEQTATVVIKGTINYLKKENYNPTHGFMSVGFGFGSGGRKYRGIDMGVEHSFFGNDDFTDSYNLRYKYDGQASLLIQVKNAKLHDNYSTNLNFLTEENTYSTEYVTKMFNEQIVKKIIEYLQF